jgi:hypothetical protein
MVVVKMVWNPNDVRTRTGPDGRYTVRGLPPGLTHQIWAWHEFTHGGRSYCSRLAMATPAEYEAFVPGDGAVRNFRWQLTGRIPDAGSNHFGASIALVATDELWESLEDGDDIELRLVPDGPLVDGSEASVITRTIPFARSGWASRVDDLPHGTYTAAVTRLRGGVRTPLAVGRLGSGQRASTAAVRWEPARSPGSCGHVLGADLQTFSLQIAPT